MAEETPHDRLARDAEPEGAAMPDRLARDAEPQGAAASHDLPERDEPRRSVAAPIPAGDTELLPGGGRPAKVEESVREAPGDGARAEEVESARPDAGAAAHPASGEGRPDPKTLPMPKPGSRPDDPTEALERDEGDDPSAPKAVEPGTASAPTIPHLTRRQALTAAGVAVVALGGIGWVTYATELWGGRSLPDVRGISFSDAKARLAELGLDATELDRPTDDGIGTVLETDPSAGTRVRAGRSVKVYVGTPRVVPDVVGMQLDEARAALAEAGIDTVRIERKNSDEEEGTALATNPSKDAVVTSGEEVVLTVAQPYTVPDVTGMSQDDATRTIADAGLESKIEWRESEGAARSALSTEPAAGERVKAGSTVTITVVAPGARDETYLADYLTSAPRDVSSYLSWKGWSFRYGKTAAGAGSFAGVECAETGWTKAGTGTLYLTPSPQSSDHGSFLGELLTHDVLADGAAIAGVRFVPEQTGDAANPTVDSATINTWATRCGLSGLAATVSGDQAAAAAGKGGAVPDMLAGYGEADGNVWCVSVVKGRGVAVVCAPKGLYDDVDLSSYDGSIGMYLAVSAGYGA